MTWRPLANALLLGLLGSACSYDRGDRWQTKAAIAACGTGQARCAAGVLERCEAEFGSPSWVRVEDCAENGLLCSVEVQACTLCPPGERTCDGADVMQCDARGDKQTLLEHCDTEKAESCRKGQCRNLCGLAAQERSNVGCEYWAVDLDNAVIDAAKNAASQQYAVVISNPHSELPVTVRIERDDSDVGSPNDPVEIVSATIAPFGLQKFLLGPREVDGSKPGTYNTGTHSALTRSAYRIRSTVPVVAYQFNPLDNVDVFSNDASLLKPVEALGSSGSVENRYVVLGWPQTIASTDDPETNFDPSNPDSNLRAFLTIVGTAQNTTVRLDSRAKIVNQDLVLTETASGLLESKLDAFDVLNLETDAFNGDFSGSLVYSDNPVVAFSGSEASDAPWFKRLSDRRCCADHLEEQLDPIRTAGKRFIVPVSFNRSLALSRAGASIKAAPEPEYFRIMAATTGGARVKTTLMSHERLSLEKIGDFVELTSSRDFAIESDAPLMLANITPSQEAAGIPTRLPGGDPSFIIVPPIEQYRQTYVFLTPDRYSFDFVRIVAPRSARMRLDEQWVEELPNCEEGSQADLDQALEGSIAAEYVVYRCQLTFPVIDPTKDPSTALSAGDQRADGVHTLVSSAPALVLVDGFDVNVSYGYAGGTELTEIVTR